MNKKKDIEYEMSRFEEEITKLTPSTAVISAPPVNQFSIKTVDSTSSTSYNVMLPPSYHSAYNFATPSLPMAPSYLTPASVQMSTYKSNVAPPKVEAPAPSAASTPATSGVKRDAGGNVKSVPTTAAAAATAVAAAQIEADKKKAKDAKEKKNKHKKFVRCAGGQTWEDESLQEWDPDDFRLFCGDLGNEVTDESLTRAFSKYPSFQKAKVIRDKRTSKTKGYGFVSFKDSTDFIKAMREMDGKYVGNRPIKLRKSNWQDRNLDIVRRKEGEKQKMGFK